MQKKLYRFLSLERKLLIASVWYLALVAAIIATNNPSFQTYLWNLGLFFAGVSIYLLGIFLLSPRPGKQVVGRNHALTTIGLLLLPVAILASLTQWVHSGGDLLSAVSCGVAGVVVALCFLFLMKYSWRQNIRVAHFPNAPRTYRDSPADAAILRVVFMLGVVAALILITSLLPLAAQTVIIIVAILLLVTIIFAFPALRYAVYIRKLRRALELYDPTFAVFHDGLSQLHWDMWLPYILQSGEKVLLVATWEQNFLKRSAQSEIPIVLVDDAAQILTAFPKGLKAVFYPRNGKINSEIIAGRPKAKHVFLHHGDGDKPASSAKSAGRHDILVVAGRAAIDRYAMRGVEIPKEKFRILGRPASSEFKEVQPVTGSLKNPRVLYAPTWKGVKEEANFSSLEFGPEIVKRLLERKFAVIFRPHPSGQYHKPHKAAIKQIKQMLELDAKQTGLAHIWGPGAETERTLADVANISDLMIADVSGTVTDYMQTLKPFIMVSTKMPVADFIETFPTARSAYVVDAQNITTLETALDQAFGDDPLAETRKERRDYYLGGFGGSESVDAFVNFLAELASN